MAIVNIAKPPLGGGVVVVEMWWWKCGCSLSLVILMAKSTVMDVHSESASNEAITSSLLDLFCENGTVWLCKSIPSKRGNN